jgi:ribonucleoside-triphosphate reductase (thioredoxin)
MQKGVPNEPDITNSSNQVFYFPERSPTESVDRKELSALEQLEHYLIFKKHWCEHNPSITVYVRESEWLDVQAWVYKNFDDIGGIAFLPYSDHIYQQAPYSECTEEQYQTAKVSFPVLDFTEVVEKIDNTTGSQELACLAGVCEV